MGPPLLKQEMYPCQRLEFEVYIQLKSGPESRCLAFGLQLESLRANATGAVQRIQEEGSTAKSKSQVWQENLKEERRHVFKALPAWSGSSLC